MRAVLHRWLDELETRHGRLKGIERRNALPPNPHPGRRRHHQEGNPMKITTNCPAALNVRGEHFPCDWPSDVDGKHPGMAHANKDAEAIWTDDPQVLTDAWRKADPEDAR